MSLLCEILQKLSDAWQTFLSFFFTPPVHTPARRPSPVPRKRTRQVFEYDSCSDGDCESDNFGDVHGDVSDVGGGAYFGAGINAYHQYGDEADDFDCTNDRSFEHDDINDRRLYNMWCKRAKKKSN